VLVFVDAVDTTTEDHAVKSSWREGLAVALNMNSAAITQRQAIIQVRQVCKYDASVDV
jgi:hypothetical protein